MLGNLETPRPLPPAKARRASALKKLTATPPPAYTFPRRQDDDDPFRHDWDDDHDDEDEWMSEKSREELKDLLLKADGIIKERENELGLASAVCKGLYQNNVALQSKHQALVARFPSTSSPDLRHRIPSNPSAAASPDASPTLYRRHTRKVSIATADISLLADQNAELLDKLEKLEVEATSADHAGRRELKRLEKEITYLREALERTQAKSEALEEKVQDAVVGEAWRRKKVREAKFRAMRRVGRQHPWGEVEHDADDDDDEQDVRDFAPVGSKFGGPSDALSFFPSNSEPLPEHALISQLLSKVKELEHANTRILHQQSETADQLSAMQRDTAHIAKVYECLSDPELELEESRGGEEGRRYRDRDRDDDDSTIRFRSLRRSIANEMNENATGTRIVHPRAPPRPEFMTVSKSKNRKSVMGLFDDPQSVSEDTNEPLSSSSTLPSSSSASTSTSTWTDGMQHPGTLSPLRLFSPMPTPDSMPNPEAEAFSPPPPGGPTLQSELAGADWGSMRGSHHHLRTTSLYDMTFSVPGSPSPQPGGVGIGGSMSRERDASGSRGVEVADDEKPTPNATSTPLLMSTRAVRLSVDPPTPHKHAAMGLGLGIVEQQETPAQKQKQQLGVGLGDVEATTEQMRSPRIQMISNTLRGRTHRWAERRRLGNGRLAGGDVVGGGSSDSALSVETAEQEKDEKERVQKEGIKPAATGTVGRLSNAINNLIDGFDEFAGTVDAGTLMPEETDEEGRTLMVEGETEAELDTDISDDESEAELHDQSPNAYIHRRTARTRTHTSPSPPRTATSSPSLALTTTTSPSNTPAGASGTMNQGMLLQVWLWFQFALVVLVFVYAMAKRGPTAVLADDAAAGKNRRAVARSSRR